MKNLMFLFAFLFIGAGIVFATDRIDKDDGIENILYSDLEVDLEVVFFEMEKSPDKIPILENDSDLLFYADLKDGIITNNLLKLNANITDKRFNKARDNINCDNVHI